MTQNDGNPSISGGFDLEDDSGFILEYGQLTWGWWQRYIAGSGSIELDGYLGYSGSFNDDAGYDIGYIATYPDLILGILKSFI